MTGRRYRLSRFSGERIDKALRKKRYVRQEDILQIEEDIAVNQQDIIDLQTDTTDFETRIAALEATVPNLVTLPTFNALEVRVTNVEGDVVAIQNQLDTPTLISAIDNTLADHETRLVAGGL